MTDEALRDKLKRKPSPNNQWLEPDWDVVEKELRKKGVTRSLLWDEYRAATDERFALSYREFCRRFESRRKRLGLVMRQEHLAGEKLFVDFAGGRPYWSDPETGKKHYTELFVACMGASNYIYAEACADQKVETWIDLHVNAFEYLGGVPNQLIPDNLKAAVVSRPRGLDPVLNRAYHSLADHFGAIIVPTRVRRPRDKGVVELSVKLVHRALTAILRRRTFFSLAELNLGVREVIESLNSKPFRRLPDVTRASLFAQIDRPALRPLPATPFENREFRTGIRVGPDYHVRNGGGAYSVPSRFVGKSVEVRAGRTDVEVWHLGERIAVHLKVAAGQWSTTPEHRPESHNAWAQQEAIALGWASEIGAAASSLASEHANRKRPRHLNKSAINRLRDLSRRVGPKRFEQACQKAIDIGCIEIRVLENLLDKGLESAPLEAAATAVPTSIHAEIRGPDYYSEVAQ